MPYKIIENSPTESKSSFGAGSIIRMPFQIAAGAAAAVPGTFGDAAKFVHSLLVNPANKLLGNESTEYEQSLWGKILPTTQQHLQTLQKHIPFLKPKNKVEKFAQDIATDAASLFLPGKFFKMGRYAMTPLRSLGYSAAANTIGTGVSLMSGDEHKGDMVKAGSMLAFSLFNPTTAKNVSSNLYRQAEQILPQNATVNATNFVNRLSGLENKILKGRPKANVAQSEKVVLDEVDKFKNIIQNNTLNIPQAVAQKRSFNEALSKQLFELPDRASRARARELMLDLSHATNDALKEYGQINPQWWHFQSSADIAHGAIAQSNYISRVLEKYMKGRPEGIAHLFGISAPAIASHFTGYTLPAATAGLYQGTKIAHRMMASPELRKHYIKVLGAAKANNPQAIEKELNDLEKEIKKEQRKSKTKYKLIKR